MVDIYLITEYLKDSIASNIPMAVVKENKREKLYPKKANEHIHWTVSLSYY